MRFKNVLILVTVGALFPVSAIAQDTGTKWITLSPRIWIAQAQTPDSPSFFWDACRNNPMAASLTTELETNRGLGLPEVGPRSVGVGLAEVATSAGTFIAFANEPGSVALDGKGANSPFTSALVRHIGTPGEEVGRVLQRVRTDVIEATGGSQIPRGHSSLTRPFRIRKAERKPVPP